MKTLGIFVALAVYASSSVVRAEPPSFTGCEKRYLDLFRKPEIKVTLAIGYNNLDPDSKGNMQVEDRVIEEGIKKVLERPCQSIDQQICEFQLDTEISNFISEARTWKKTVFGPDGSIKTLRIEVASPSVTGSSNTYGLDSENRKSTSQKTRSEDLRKFYFNGLKNSQIVFYLGHSRDGGGPDFDPPILGKDHHVDYDYYHHHPQDKYDMLSAVAKSAGKSQIVGFFSCNSIRWFEKRTQNVAPGTGMIGTTADYYGNGFSKDVSEFLEHIFSYDCLERFKVKDVMKSADVEVARPWYVADSLNVISPVAMESRIAENLSLQLQSKDRKIRTQAYHDLKELDVASFSKSVRDRINNYEDFRSIKNLFGY